MKRASIVCCVALFAGVAGAAESDTPTPTRLTLTPKAPPVRALQYQLLPELRDQKPGNAAEHYRKACRLLKDKLKSGWRETIQAWLEMQLKELPTADVAAFLKPHAEALRELEAGARCENCDWGLTTRLRQAGHTIVWGDEDQLRALAWLLSLRARSELAANESEKAFRSVQTGFAFARHLAESGWLGGSVIAASTMTGMLPRVEEILQNPKAPNLYWALTDLPRPFIDLRRGLQGDRLTIYGNFPGLAEAAADPNASPMSPEQIKKCVDVLFDYFLVEGKFGFADRWAFGFLVLRKHERAKQALIQQGCSPDSVEAMPHMQVALLHATSEYDRVLDEYAKWQSLPYWEAAPGIEAARHESGNVRAKSGMRSELADEPAIPLAALLLPEFRRVYKARARVERRIDALRCVEAIRLYAAAHGGKLPAKLDDIKEVPVPMDPATGKAFRYKLDGDKAVLECEPNLGDQIEISSAPTYELILNR
jgi:hypothetical protein